MINRYNLVKFARKLRLKRIALAMGSGILVLAIAFYWGNNFKKSDIIGKSLLIKIGGKDIGYVANQEILSKIVDSVEEELANRYDTEVIVNTNIIETRVVNGVNEYLNEEVLAKELSQSAAIYLEGASIKINGKKVLSVKDKTVARDVLTAVKKSYLNKGSAYLDVYFEEKPVVSVENVKVNEILTYDEAVRLLLTGTIDKREHVVKKGETFWTIAKKYGLKVDSLIDSNPGIDEERLQIGKAISLSIPVPYLHVISIEKSTISEKVNYPIEYDETNILYQGEEKVKQEGMYGVKTIEKLITRKNGQECNTETVAEAIIKEPRKQIVLLGIKAQPLIVGTGELVNPTRGNGILTSSFGKRWGRTHQGVDIADDRGASIYAADRGEVVFSGWKGNYGNLVIIDHGDNRSTYYGHCDKLLVEIGEIVEKNQEIAKMGDTGKTTGVHVHFEVRVNNIPQDPSKHIEY